MRGIFYLFAENAEIADWLAERGGLETPVSREVFPKENLREYWRNFVQKSASIVLRTSSLSVRRDFPRQP
jgi:hypothetical protein